MTNTLQKRQASWYVLALVTVAVCGCQSAKKWSTAWKEKSKPQQVANEEEIVTYWGQKKKQPKPAVMPPELKEKLAKRTEETQRSRTYADHVKEGNEHLKANRLEDARRSYELALTTKPGDPDVHHRLAVVADKEKLFGVADDHYEAALRQRPRDPNLLSDLGYSHFLRGNDPQAERTLQQALSIDSSHKGAMANLGAIYAKQGRYDEALAMFRHGATEAAAQQYIAELFPKGRPIGASPAGTALAQNPMSNGQRTAPPMPGDNRTDVGHLSFEQVKAEMERQRQEGIQKRQQQQLAEISPGRDWTADRPASTQPQNPASGQPWIVGPPANSGTTTTPPQNQAQVTPYGFNPSMANNSTTGPLTAPAGTNPQEKMEFWQGLPVQQQQAAAPNGNSPQPPSNPNPWGPPPTAGGPVGLDLSRLADTLQPSGGVEQARYQGEPSGGGGGSSAIQAAAQLGMSAGPGSLFPVVPSDPAAGYPGNAMPSPPFAPRFSVDFTPPPQYQLSAPPQYQNPSNQFAPSGPSNWPADPRFSTPAGAAWNNSSIPGQSTPHPSPAGNDPSTSSIAPPSPANNWPRPADAAFNWQQPGNSPPVVQAGGASSPWGQSSVRSTDAMDAFQSEMNAGANSRAAASGWGNAATSTAGPRPYSGNWPSGNSSPTNTPAGGASVPNTLPAWNGGSAANGSGQSSFGSSTGGAAEDSLQQWPYAPRR